jgi:hypothetical protein
LLPNPTPFIANVVVRTHSSKLTLIHKVRYSASKLILLINHALWAGPPTDPPIRSAAIRAVIDQASRLNQDGQGHLSNEALILQEYENRSEYNVTVHRLEHHLTITKLLYAEQECLVALMQERKVSPVAELPSV